MQVRGVLLNVLLVNIPLVVLVLVPNALKENMLVLKV
jgi:hypothetical protein